MQEDITLQSLKYDFVISLILSTKNYTIANSKHKAIEDQNSTIFNFRIFIVILGDRANVNQQVKNMASTTKNKKEIVDFLWEWAESNGEWSKLLIDKIVSTESNLIPADRNKVFNYFLQSINLHTGLPALTTTKPKYVPTDKIIELESLSNITGVNKLAKNQTLKFSKNITVIYGENGNW